ncbi:MAG: tRNA pseudouridine(55) synthase TruB [Prevotellaceae bacterium]|jgi:tRNA pseudouridine55 synthase|nr:tRNA pseudouridine(55) synthase TruB [Prevotellaceae bacterium]
MNDFEEKLKEGLVFSVDKPYKWTSSDVVRKVRSILRYQHNIKKIKAGHAGTLDPLATGVLVVCIGKATKQAEEIQSGEKEYIADIRFGATTPCIDLEKPIDAIFQYEHITRESLEIALQKFTGTIEQVPPLFSAKMINGTRAYEFARKGENVEIKSSTINIREIEIIKFDLPDIVLRIVCSKGTYIRSIARDLGFEMQSGAHLTNLCRTRSGNFLLHNSLNINDLEFFFKNNETK